MFGLIVFAVGLLVATPGFLGMRANRGWLAIGKENTYQGPSRKSIWSGLGCFSYMIFAFGLMIALLGFIVIWVRFFYLTVH